MTTFFRLLILGGAASLLAMSGCQSPDTTSTTPPPRFATPAPGPTPSDPRTAAVMQENEQWYIAEKNSVPTRQADAERKKREKERQQQEQQNADAAK